MFALEIKEAKRTLDNLVYTGERPPNVLDQVRTAFEHFFCNLCESRRQNSPFGHNETDTFDDQGEM